MKWYEYVLIMAGTVIVCIYNQTLAGLLLFAAGIGIIAVLWVRFMAEVLADDARDEAERIAQERYQEMVNSTEYRVHVRQTVVCGKGYENADTKRTKNHKGAV